VYLAYRDWQTLPRDWRGVLWKEAVYAGGVVLPFAITCLILLASGAFSKFWFWTFVYAREYATTTGIGEGLGVLRIMLPSVVLPGLWIWVLAGVGLTAVAWNRQARERRFLLITFLLFSILAVCPGLYFRGHYFILMLPAIALLVGVAASSVRGWVQEKSPANAQPWLLPALIFLAAFANTIYVQRGYLFRMDAWNASKTIYGANPFPEAVEVAGYLKDHATPGARIAVLGSEPEIYFYSGLRSATGYIYTYGLMEPQPYALQMQKEMIAEIEAAQPEYIVFVGVPQSFGKLPGSEEYIFRWIDSYLWTQYDIVGVADILPQTNYVWGDDARNYQPRSSSYIRVFKRKAF
jgi:hypothetical protein